jgi:hypothetical protein
MPRRDGDGPRRHQRHNERRSQRAIERGGAQLLQQHMLVEL